MFSGNLQGLVKQVLEKLNKVVLRSDQCGLGIPESSQRCEAGKNWWLNKVEDGIWG